MPNDWNQHQKWRQYHIYIHTFLKKKKLLLDSVCMNFCHMSIIEWAQRACWDFFIRWRISFRVWVYSSRASSRALDVRVIYANIESFMKSVLFIYWFKIHDDWLKQISYIFSEYEWKCQMLSEATGNQKPPKALRYYLHEHSNVVDILNWSVFEYLFTCVYHHLTKILYMNFVHWIVRWEDLQ